MPAETRKSEMEAWTARAIDEGNFDSYKLGIIHDWLRTLTVLATVLVPLFIVLDYFMMPSSLLPRFALFRMISASIALFQLIVVRLTRPSKLSYVHGYLMSVQVGGIIALMTTYLGGFNSSYYAGLNLVIIGVNLLMPWRAEHSALNTGIIVLMYIVFNLIAGGAVSVAQAANNVFFLLATAVITVSINHVRYRLIQKEFSLLVNLKQARDALWGEMELAKRIQTALLPQKHQEIHGWETAVTMIPATEVGGDYYEILETESGERWAAIGDVTGHGVDSGLIMMMAQTSIMTVIKGNPKARPIEVLVTANSVIREDIRRLGSNHYMTMMVMRVEDGCLTMAGHHQDVLIYRAARGAVETVATGGTWLGITDQIEPFLELRSVDVADNDVILLFTDGITEGKNSEGEMYGQERLSDALARFADLPLEKALERIIEGVRSFQVEQEDDLTLILMRKKPSHNGGERRQ